MRLTRQVACGPPYNLVEPDEMNRGEELRSANVRRIHRTILLHRPRAKIFLYMRLLYFETQSVHLISYDLLVIDGRCKL